MEFKSDIETMERKFVAEEFKVIVEGDEKGTVEGYASTYGNVDKGRDVVEKGAYDKTLAEHEKAGTLPHMYFNHNSNEPIGDWTKMESDSKGLKIKGKLWVGQGIQKAEQAYNMLKSKTKRGFSIGYITRDSSRDEKTGIRRLLQLDLHEVSPTPNPMNEKCMVTGIKSSLLLDEKSVITIRDAEEILRDAGMSAAEAKSMLAKLRSAFDALRDADTAAKSQASTEINGSIDNLIKALKG